MTHFSGRCTLTLLALLALLFSMANLGVTTMVSSDCCLSYTRKPLPMKAIYNYSTQRSHGVCDRNAIVFRTRRDCKICANPKDLWVKKAVKILKTKVNRHKSSLWGKKKKCKT